MAMILQLHEGVPINKFQINKSLLRIGRTADNDIFIDDLAVSKQHAIIEVIESSLPDEPNEYFIKDLESTNSTFVNGRKIARKKLKNNDVIRVGRNNFKFADENAPPKDEKTAKIHKSWIPGVFYTKD